MRFTVRGIALEPHAETIGATGIEKKWPSEEIEAATETLIGQPITRDSSKTVDNVVGSVVDAKYDEDEGLIYEAEIEDTEVAEKLREGIGELAPRMYHEVVGSAEVEEQDGPAVITDLEFDALFMCPQAADGVPGVTEVTEENNE